MDKLRTLSLAFLCWLICPPAFAQTTIGPGTPGVTESIMTLQQTSVVDGIPFFSPVFTPVPLGSVVGGLGSGDWNVSMGCLQGCSADLGFNGPFEMFDISFNKPVSFVTALQASGTEMAINLYAYNSADQMVGSCSSGVDGPPWPSSGCFKFVSQSNPPGQVTGSYTVANSMANISTVLIGGSTSDQSAIVSAAFSATPIEGVPEPGTFSLFALTLIGVAITRRRALVDCRRRFRIFAISPLYAGGRPMDAHGISWAG